MGKKDDIKGEMINEWIDTQDLILLNSDEKCNGTYTWGRMEQKSTLDMVLVNQKMYEKYKSMEIDEDKKVILFSDHNLIKVELSLGEEYDIDLKRTSGKSSLTIRKMRMQ